MATEQNWEEIIRTNYTELLKNISSEFGLFGELKKARIFTPIALKSFTDCKDTTERIDRILRNLQKKDFESFKKFCIALDNSEQGHIVRNHLSKVQDVSCRPPTTVTDSPSNEDSSQYRSISYGMSECFKQHWNDLIAEITFDEGLLSLVDKSQIFTTLQLNKLRDIDNESKRTEQMLTWLERGSEKQFVDFSKALEANNQLHVVKQYLEPNKYPGRRIPSSSSLVIERNQAQSRVIQGFQEISIIPEVGGISFSPCSKEFLDGFKAKVLQKTAYRCESKPRGRALIINNRTFFNFATRYGSDVDTEKLEALFKRLKFDTVVHDDKDAQEMSNILLAESQNDLHKNCDMFVLFVMSHGIHGEIYGTDGNSIKTKKIMNFFNGENCQNLVGKPKLFFIQACQGEVKTSGVTTTTTDAGRDPPGDSVRDPSVAVETMIKQLDRKEDFRVSVPLEPLPTFASDGVADANVHEMADMAVIYATVEGYVAWRRIDTGSLFVHCLVDVLTKQAHETELMKMITKTFDELHKLEMIENQGRYKQIGEKRDSLRREVYLLPH